MTSTGYFDDVHPLSLYPCIFIFFCVLTNPLWHRIQIFKFTGSIATQGTMILGAGGVNNTQSVLHSETGFIVRLHAHDAENLLSRPCVGCKGFRIIHAGRSFFPLFVFVVNQIISIQERKGFL